jgi:hypothetical protein
MPFALPFAIGFADEFIASRFLQAARRGFPRVERALAAVAARR